MLESVPGLFPWFPFEFWYWSNYRQSSVFRVCSEITDSTQREIGRTVSEEKWTKSGRASVCYYWAISLYNPSPLSQNRKGFELRPFKQTPTTNPIILMYHQSPYYPNRYRHQLTDRIVARTSRTQAIFNGTGWRKPNPSLSLIMIFTCTEETNREFIYKNPPMNVHWQAQHQPGMISTVSLQSRANQSNRTVEISTSFLLQSRGLKILTGAFGVSMPSSSIGFSKWIEVLKAGVLVGVLKAKCHCLAIRACSCEESKRDQ